MTAVLKKSAVDVLKYSLYSARYFKYYSYICNLNRCIHILNVLTQVMSALYIYVRAAGFGVYFASNLLEWIGARTVAESRSWWCRPVELG